MNEDTGFFRSLRGLATDWVQTKRKSLQEEPLTDVDSAGGRGAYSFQGQELSFDDLREIKDMRDSGGQVAALMQSKALLHFGEGAEVGVDNNEDTAQEVMGSEMTLEDFIEFAFPDLDLLVLDLGKDALWYPYAVGEIRENRAGQFDEFLPAEPYTLLPETDHKGEIQRWHQRVQTAGGYKRQQLDPTEIVHIILNKSSARDTTGISEVLRNKEEIQAFKSNEEAIQQAIELHGFPQRHVQVGREDGAPVRDDELRRVRNIFDPRNTDANTAYFTGQDVNIDTIEAENFDYQAVHEMSTRKLTTALGLPLEAGNVGSDGLGSGKPAELRETMLKLEIKANQRQFATQFVEQVIRPVVRDYSPFDHTRNIDLTINDPLSSQEDVADIINKIGDYLTNAEVRSRLDLPEPDDDEIAEGYRNPADIETPEEEQGGGLFGSALQGRDTDFRSLETPQGVPDNANPISDRSECDGQVVTGDRGGLYCVPAGEEPATGDGDIEDRANPDGTIDVTDLQQGDTVLKGDDEVTIDGVEEDDIGTLVGFTDAESGEEYMIYNDMLEDFEVPGVDGEGEETPDTDTGTEDGSEEFEPGDEVLSPTGEPATITAYDPETNTVAYETEGGEEMFSTVEGLESTEVEDETDAKTERVLEETNLPDNVSVGVEDMDDSRVDALVDGLNDFDDAVGIEDADLFTIQDTPQDDVSEAAGAAYHTGQRSLYVKPDAVDEDTRRQEFEAGFLATETPEGSIHHEMMHAKHTQNVLQSEDLDLDELREVDFDDDTAQLIEDEVSTYAATNATEFVAEVGSSIVERDASYSDEIMELYNQYGGPEVSQ